MHTYIHAYVRVKTICNHKWSKVVHETQSAQISKKQDGHNIYVMMKTMCSPGYHHKTFVAAHVLGYMMYVMYTELHHCI